MKVIHMSDEVVEDHSIEDQETQCLVDCFKRHCALTNTPLNLARICRIVDDINPHKYEYWVDQGEKSMAWIMGRDLQEENRKPKLIIIYPLRLQDGRRN